MKDQDFLRLTLRRGLRRIDFAKEIASSLKPNYRTRRRLITTSCRSVYGCAAHVIERANDAKTGFYSVILRRFRLQGKKNRYDSLEASGLTETGGNF